MKTASQKRPDRVFLSVAFLALILAALACSSQPAPSAGPTAAVETSLPPEPAGDQIICRPGIIPGTTTRGDVISLLGEPAAAEQAGAYEVLSYESAVPRLYNTVFIADQKVVRLDMLVDENDLAYSTVKAAYGEAARLTYSYFQPGAMTFLFPEQGLAVIAHEDSDRVFMMQCFLPMSLEDYMNSWGAGLPLTNPYTQ